MTHPIARLTRPFVALCWLALLVASASVVAQSARPAIDHQALWTMPRVTAPVPSPDGRWVVATVVEPSYDSDRQRPDLWLLASDGSAPPRRLTWGGEAETGVTWSPDSRRIAFSSHRQGDGAPQIHVLDMDGGDAMRATALSSGARMPQFSPDGRHLLFVSDVHPQARDDEDSRRIARELKERDHSARVYTGFPIRLWDRWIEPRQPRVFVQQIGDSTAQDVMQGSALLAAPGYGGRTALSGEELDAIWAPDGRSVIVVASRNRDRAAYDFTHADLWQFPLDGSTPRRLTGSDDPRGGDSYQTPRFSPDGKRLYALVTPRSDKVYNASRLAVFDWPSARPLGRIELPDARSVSGFAIAPDGRRLYLSGEDGGHEKIYLARADERRARLAFDIDSGVYSQLGVGGSGGDGQLFALHESAARPPEVVRIDLARGGHVALSAFARDKAAALDLADLDTFWIERDGRRIHSMLLKPPGFDPARRYPLLVLMHGGPHTMWRDMWVLRWNYHLLAAPGYAVLLTNYTGSTGFGEDFAQGIQGDPLKGPADDINAAADHAIAHYPWIDGERQCAAGASYGGHLANWMQASTDRYRCLISHAGLVNLKSQWGTSDVAYSREVSQGGPHWEDIPLWQEQNPIRYAARFRTPTLVTFGERDYRVPINNGLEYWAALQRQQVESRLVVFPDENHWILKAGNSRYFYQEIHDWLARWLKD